MNRFFLLTGRPVRAGVLALGVLAVALARPWTLFAQGPEPAKGVKYAQISPADLKDWLTDLASISSGRRQVFTEGYGMATAHHRGTPQAVRREADGRRAHALAVFAQKG
jgi:hypothetical protein